MLRGNRFPGLEVPIDSILYLSFPAPLSLSLSSSPCLFLSPFFSVSTGPSICLSLFLSSAFAQSAETLARRGSFIAFHFRDELTRSIGAWQKCNAREVRGHRLRSYTCEGEKQGPRAILSRLHLRSALCELSHRALARPRYETTIIRVK